MPLSKKWQAISVTGGGVHTPTGDRFHYELGFLSEHDAPQVLVLQGRVLAVAPKPLPLYVREERYFAECAAERGCIVGAWHDDRLIAYSVLRIPAEGEENYGDQIGLPADELTSVGHAAGSGVDPDYRGNGFQRSMVALRNDFALDSGYVHVCGEILPTNAFSIHNHFAHGFFLKGFKVDRFKLDVYLLHNDLRVVPALVDEPTQEWDITDVEWYRRMLDEGFWGFRLTKRGGDWHLTCGRFS